MKTLFTILLLILVNSQFILSQDVVDNSKVVKVLTFNIYHGETMNGDFNLDTIARVIIDTDPDLVALQEVDYKTNRARKCDLVTELGYMAKMTPLFGRAMYFDDGEYGEGILSKSTFLETRNIPLPYTSGNEPRTALEVTTVLASGDTIAFIGTHLDHLADESDRIAQVKKINDTFSSNIWPTILAGDLNAVPESKPITTLEEVWSSSYNKNQAQPTFPSDHPRVKIDYVMFYPKNKWKVINTKVIQDSVASDHCAYLATFELLD